MRTKLLTTLVISLATLCSAHGGTLGVFHGSQFAGGQLSAGGMGLKLLIGDGCPSTGFGAIPGPNCYTIFNQVLTPASVGTPISITSATNSDFNNVAGLLTNGTPDSLFEDGYFSGGPSSPVIPRRQRSVSPRGLTLPVPQSRA